MSHPRAPGLNDSCGFISPLELDPVFDPAFVASGPDSEILPGSQIRILGSDIRDGPTLRHGSNPAHGNATWKSVPTKAPRFSPYRYGPRADAGLPSLSNPSSWEDLESSRGKG
jgi:hypothetical protein